MNEPTQNKNDKEKSKRRDKIIYGRHPVLEALKREIVKRVYLYKGVSQAHFLRELNELCDQKGIQVKIVTTEYLESRLGKSNHQGVLAEVTAFEYADFQGLLRQLDSKKPSCVLVLAHLEDPGNLGAILRTAAAFNVSGVILPKNRAATVNATVAKTSAGTLGMVPITIVPNLKDAVNKLKEMDFWAVGSDSHAKDELADIEFPNRSVIIIGGESKGVPPLLLKQCDFHVRVDINSEVESLNVSAATAIFLHMASRAMK